MQPSTSYAHGTNGKQGATGDRDSCCRLFPSKKLKVLLCLRVLARVEKRLTHLHGRAIYMAISESVTIPFSCNVRPTTPNQLRVRGHGFACHGLQAIHFPNCSKMVNFPRGILCWCCSCSALHNPSWSWTGDRAARHHRSKLGYPEPR